MNVTTIAPLKAPSKPRTRRVEDRSLVHAPPADESWVEVRRWVFGLGVPFTFAAVFFGGALATGNQNLMGPAIVLGPILMMFAVIYLCLTSDTNGTAR